MRWQWWHTHAANDPMIAIRPTGTVARRLEWVKVKVYEKTHQIGHLGLTYPCYQGWTKWPICIVPYCTHMCSHRCIVFCTCVITPKIYLSSYWCSLMIMRPCKKRNTISRFHLGVGCFFQDGWKTHILVSSSHSFCIKLQWHNVSFLSNSYVVLKPCSYFYF